MTNRRRFVELGIRERIVLLAVLPPLVMALLIADYLVQARLADAHASLERYGQAVAAYLAIAAERALPARDLDRLRALCGSTLRRAEVVRATFLTASDEPLVECGPAPRSGQSNAIFRAVISGSGMAPSDARHDNPMRQPGAPVGWAEVQISRATTLAHQRQMLLTSLIIIASGLLLSLIAGLAIGAGISAPLLALSRGMSRYRRGEKGVRIDPRGSGEIGELIRDFNRMATALEESHQLLQEQVSQATAELQHTVAILSERNTELESAREAALKAGREKQEFLARMSHEIRTPLNAVIGFSRLLRRNPDQAGIGDYTRTIDRAASQLLCIIDGILDVTRLESGNLVLEPRPFDLRDCLEDVVAMLSPAAHDKGLELALVVHRDVPQTLIGDPDRISQVMLNLLNNAVKFTHQGHVFIEAGHSFADESHDWVRILVSDTGIGLSEDAHRRLFQPFGQADSSIRRHYGGTGLGLVIAKGLVELMGGEISVDSAPGKGSRFMVAIPFQSAPRPAPALDISPLVGRKVLIYDRQAIQLRALRAILLDWSAEVFGTGQDDRLPLMLRGAADAGHPFDLLILGLDRDERRRRQLEKLATRVRLCYGGPVMVLVGTEDWTQPPALAAKDGWDWGIKPVRRSLLLDALARLIGVHVQRDTTKPGPSLPAYCGKRILVVEDNSFNRQLMHHLLGMRGLEVSEACDGLEAIALTGQTHFDLIFLDIHMPGMDGIETARRIRADRGVDACPPIVALTADVFVQERLPDGESLFQEILPKPVSEDALDKVLLRLFTSDAGMDPANAPSRGPASPSCQQAAHLSDELRHRLTASLDDTHARLASAIAAGDRQMITEIAHELNGLCGFYDLRSLAQSAIALEQAAATAPLDELSQLHQTIVGLIDHQA